MTPSLQPRSHPARRWLYYGMLALLLAGCASLNPQPPSQSNIPTPTVAPFFLNPPTNPPVAQASPARTQATPTALASGTARPTLPAPTHASDEIAMLVLYEDTLNPDWGAERSDKVRYDLASTAYVHSGKTAIMVTPAAGFGQFFLTVRKDARKIYPRDRILGVSFWLSGGAHTITPNDLAVTVVGSNQYAYWVAGDASVKIDTPVTAENPLFSETRLHFLHVNRSIPSGAWVEVVVWLDDLIYDPNYTYITGLYLKNDESFLDRYYIDDVQLLVQRRG